MANDELTVQQNELYEKALHRFTDYLKTQSLKMTRERRLILKEIYKADSHLEAEDLLMIFRKKGDKVSRATIYRTFDLLVKAGLIVKSDFGHNHFHYEKNFGQSHHDHMVCTHCGKVIEFNDPRLEQIQKEAAREHNFGMTSHSLQIFGLCKDCK